MAGPAPGPTKFGSYAQQIQRVNTSNQDLGGLGQDGESRLNRVFLSTGNVSGVEATLKSQATQTIKPSLQQSPGLH
jgi:hypothetical protein